MQNDADAIEDMIAAGDWQALAREGAWATFRDFVHIARALAAAPDSVSSSIFGSRSPQISALARAVAPALIDRVTAAAKAGYLVRFAMITDVRLGRPNAGLLIRVEEEAFLCRDHDCIPIDRLVPPAPGEWLFSEDPAEFAVAVAALGGHLYVWAGDEGGIWQRYSGFEGIAQCWRSIPGRGLVVAGTDRGEVVFWKLGEPEPTYIARLSDGVDVLLASDAGDLMVGSTPSCVAVWSLPEFRRVTAIATRMHDLAISGDGKTLAGFHGYMDLRVWDLPSGSKRFDFEPDPYEDDGGIRMRLTPDGRLVTIASVMDDDTIRVYDAADGSRVTRLPTGGIYYTITPDSRFLLDADLDGIKIWDMLMLQRHAHIDERFSMSPILWSVSPESRSAACGGWGNPLVLLDIQAGQMVSTASAYEMSMSYWPALNDAPPRGATHDLSAEVEADLAELHQADPLATVLRLWQEAATWQASQQL